MRLFEAEDREKKKKRAGERERVISHRMPIHITYVVADKRGDGVTLKAWDATQG